MRLKSCFIRYVRFMLRSCACSVFTFFINSGMLLNKSGLWLVSSVIFAIIMAGDAWFFGQYFGKRRHIKYGIVYPYALFILTSYLGHFAIASARWRYFFLPLGVFENCGLSRLLSITLMHLIVLFAVFVFSYTGQKRFYKKN